jgi:hypothetical protein
MSFILSLLVTGLLSYELYSACNHEDPTLKKQCDNTAFPFVSEITINTIMNNRLFILTSTILTWGVNQQNIRAYYKMLYGKISDKYNDFLLILGYASAIMMPLLGLFDMNKYYDIHFYLAIGWLVSLAAYLGCVGKELSAHKKEFPDVTRKQIRIIGLAASGVFIGIAALAGAYHTYGVNYPTPLIQWVMFLYNINFFALISITNNFYDTVHDGADLKKKQ